MNTTFPCWIISVEPSIFHKPRNISSERRGLAAFPNIGFGAQLSECFIESPYTRARPSVGAGIMFAHNALHGSGQAGFPHPALALGEDAHAAQGVGMTDGRRRQPASDEAPHAATYPVQGWEHACFSEVRLSPRSASPATSCVSSAATPCTFRCFSSSRR